MFIVRTITSKPANVNWFRRDPESTVETVSQFMAQQLSDGAFVKNRNRKIGKHKLVNTMVFNEQADYDKWRAAADANLAYTQRTEYNQANGMTTVVKKFLRIE